MNILNVNFILAKLAVENQRPDKARFHKYELFLHTFIDRSWQQGYEDNGCEHS